MPIFSSTPARMTEPAVGASTCASGSQVWNGNSGTLMAKASAKARKNQSCVVRGERAARRAAAGRSCSCPVACACMYARPMMATSISTLPAIV